MRPLFRTLEVLSIAELGSIAVLLINLATVHVPGVASVLGPLHGALYLAVSASALFGRNLLLRTRLCAVIPVLGGILTLINVRLEHRRTTTGTRSTRHQNRRST